MRKTQCPAAIMRATTPQLQVFENHGGLPGKIGDTFLRYGAIIGDCPEWHWALGKVDGWFGSNTSAACKKIGMFGAC
jgi:hypothetical protein